MVVISVIGLEKGLFPHCQDQTEEFQSALEHRVGASTTCLMLEVNAGAAAHSNKETARFGTSLIGRERVPFLQLQLPQPLYKKVGDRQAETGRGSGRHHHRGAKDDHRKVLDLRDANSKRRLSSNERLLPPSLTTSGETR